ncbi:MAG: hypothetical protein U0R64_02385 [Candidatus Nanopelagicales bacterium]
MSPSRWNSRGVRSWLFALTLAMLAPGLAVATAPARAANPVANSQIVDGPNDIVNATVQGGDGTTYLGGSFTWWGAQTGSGAAVRTDNAEVRRNFPKVTGGSIHAVAPDGMGGYYIGGNFDRVAGVARERLAHILPSGALDPDWDVPTDGAVFALAVSGSRVYVGGDFATLDGNALPNLGAITTAGTVDTSWSPSPDLGVRSLLVSESTLYVGGAFNQIGGAAHNFLAAFDLGTGAVNDSWDPDVEVVDEAIVSALALSGNSLFVGGHFEHVGGEARSNLAAVDATGSGDVDLGWAANADGPVKSLAVAEPTLGVPDATLVVGGDFTQVGSETRHYLAAVSVSDATVDSTWNPNPDNPVRVVAVSGSTVYAGGDFTTIDGANRNHLAALPLGTGQTGAPTSWNPRSDGGVYALAVAGATVYAGGEVNVMGGEARNRLAAVGAGGSLTSWNPNVADGPVNALVRSGSTIYVGGEFTTVAGATRNRAAAISTAGTLEAWDPNVGPGSVSALAVSGTTVYLAGGFGTVQTVTRHNLAAVGTDGDLVTTWNPDADATVRALALSIPTLSSWVGNSTISEPANGESWPRST